MFLAVRSRNRQCLSSFKKYILKHFPGPILYVWDKDKWHCIPTLEGRETAIQVSVAPLKAVIVKTQEERGHSGH